MGRTETRQEEYALARAQRALMVCAGLVAFAFAVLWLLGPLAFGDFSHRTFAVTFLLVMAAYLLLAYGVGRGSTVFWALALLLHGPSLAGTVYVVLTTPRMGNLATLAFQLWVVSRLLDPDAVRAFLRFGRPPLVTATATAPAWQPSVTRPAAPGGPSPRRESYDFFG